MSIANWKQFPCNKLELCLDTVLVCGQSFRWRKNSSGEWLGVMAGYVWRLKQSDDRILYQVYGKHNTAARESADINDKSLKLGQSNLNTLYENEALKDPKIVKNEVKQLAQTTVKGAKTKASTKRSNAKCKLPQVDSTSSHTIDSSPAVNDVSLSDDDHFSSLLHNYFQLGVDLRQLYKSWASKDPYFNQVASNFYGIRILRQDPVENLFSFVCSSNNNISRISSMVENLCTNYGEFITRLDETDYFTFPSISALCKENIETHLRQLGFGYRAKFIARIARDITENKSENWLRSLRDRPYSEAKSELLNLYGVGAKVADCVCLMSLDKTEAVPVDTHVWQITMKHYLTKLQSAKSLTDKLYNEIGDFYRSLWGPYAGWAHSVLFTADLRHNKRKELNTSLMMINICQEMTIRNVSLYVTLVSIYQQHLPWMS
uniref:N-glycosylase/DNA lyase n=1 Tax=Biomphalaria glabrata TaxID=6526 RepID=A0A2C9K4U0_BIOGL